MNMWVRVKHTKYTFVVIKISLTFSTTGASTQPSWLDVQHIIHLTSYHLSGNQWHPCRPHVHGRLPTAYSCCLRMFQCLSIHLHMVKSIQKTILHCGSIVVLVVHISDFDNYKCIFCMFDSDLHVHVVDVYDVLTCSFNSGLVTIF
jgi:hypothetical protein